MRIAYLLVVLPVACVGRGLTDNPIATSEITYLSGPSSANQWTLSTPGAPQPASDCVFQNDTDYHPETFFGQYDATSREMCCGLCDAHVLLALFLEHGPPSPPGVRPLQRRTSARMKAFSPVVVAVVD